ncbi:MAG: hypothetical protein HFH92_18175 [Lachnospiraceae bacterium]|jgi:hypothetical protein|uniref:S24/S26 family peptidase n=1 Tax=uncultured Acetatifactor sp. TaxID=1671927 RepID=UPI002620BD32|nr:S24/S26 family peptidase [uncultured Acetatifactor sp.]MCI8790980.1 hypothetical protein [Lachnospiraceae bacterium]
MNTKIIGQKIITYNLSKSKLFKLKILGSSMLPFISHGETVIVDPRDTDFQFGKLVLIYWQEGSYVVHRMMLNGKTKGDNLCKFDPDGVQVLCCVLSGQSQIKPKLIAFLSLLEGKYNANLIKENPNNLISKLRKILFHVINML